jgi:ATP-dependent NAD(P)H-hydrate dehydratase
LILVGIVEVSYGGCPRRCGGQGDVLAGITATFAYWTTTFISGRAQNMDKEGSDDLSLEFNRVVGRYVALNILFLILSRPMMYACKCACLFVRHAAMRAFKITGRGMIASDIIADIPQSLMEIEDKEI